MSKYYLAAIMDRHYLTDSILSFSCNHVALGEYDEEEEIFIDKNENFYHRMGSTESLNSKVPYSFANLMKLDDLYSFFENNIPMQEAISKYEKACKDLIHFIAKKDGETFYTVLNSDVLYQLQDGTVELTSGEYEESYEENIEDIIIEVIEGKYSLDQLKKMKEMFTKEYENIESLIDTISLQIGALEDKDEEDIVINEKPKIKTSAKPIPRKSETKSKSVPYTPPGNIDIDDLFNKVTKTLIAQDEPTRRVITELARKELDDRKKREGILLTGPTGVGKTELMRLIAKHLDRPFFKINSTKLTSPGYVGRDVEEELWDLYVQCGKDLKKAERAIIFFDEIDKKGSRRKDNVAGQGVLSVLLPFIEGSTYEACSDMKTANPHEKVKIDTSNMTIILGGAYTDVYKNLIEKNGLGFNATITSKDKPRYREATTKDFVDYGMMTDEFMGRVTVIKLNDLNADDIKRVMLESDESAIRIQEEIFRKLGVKLTFTDGFATEVAKQAEKKKTGARGLNGIIDAATWKAFADVHMHKDKYEEIILTEETVKDSSNYQYVKKK